MGEWHGSGGPVAPREAGAKASLIYHIARADDWTRARTESRYEGGALCRKDGFIHFSTREQLAGTLSRFFAGEDGLVLLAADAEALGRALKWERGPDGALYPHYYGTLSLTQLEEFGRIRRNEAGDHVLPDPSATVHSGPGGGAGR